MEIGDCCVSVCLTVAIRNIYITVLPNVSAGKVAVDADDTDTEDGPHVSLAEMLDDMHIAEDATGEAGAAMME